MEMIMFKKKFPGIFPTPQIRGRREKRHIEL